MADNVVLNAGAGGSTLATDDIGGVHYQRVKVTWGVDGATNDASAAAPLPVVQTGTLNVGTVTTVSSVTTLPNVTLAAGTNTNEVVGDAAHDAAAAGNPVLTGAYASAAAPSDVSADGDAVRLWALRSGAVAIQPTFAGVLALAGNGAAGTGVQRVTIANDSTGVLANVATIGTSVTPGTGAAHLGKAEDAAHSSADTGVMALAVRRDADTSLVDTTGDYAPLQVNAAGSLKVAITSGAGSGGTSIADAAAFTRGSTSVTPIAGVVETSAPTLTNGNTGALSLTTAGAVRVAVASGGIAGIVDDAAFTPATSEVLPVGFTFDDVSPDSVNEGDIGAARMSANRNIYVTLRDAAGNERGLNVDASGQLAVTVASLPASTNTIEVVGDVAHDAAIGGNPVRLAGRALTSDYTAVSAGDAADLITTLLGKLVTMPYANPANTWNYAAASGGIVNTTGVTAKAAAGAGVRNYITHVDVVNGHATVSTDVQIRDGASGTVLWRGFAQAAGGGCSAEFNPPLRGTANTLVEVACGTTGTATYFNLTGFVAAE